VECLLAFGRPWRRGSVTSQLADDVQRKLSTSGEGCELGIVHRVKEVDPVIINDTNYL
jgi:hypothetical protein